MGCGASGAGGGLKAASTWQDGDKLEVLADVMLKGDVGIAKGDTVLVAKRNAACDVSKLLEENAETKDELLVLIKHEGRGGQSPPAPLLPLDREFQVRLKIEKGKETYLEIAYGDYNSKTERPEFQEFKAKKV